MRRGTTFGQKLLENCDLILVKKYFMCINYIMHVFPVINSNIANFNYAQKPSFKAHPDFYKFNSTQSCYFRRGAVILANDNGYAKIENLFCKIFHKKVDTPKNMLIIGIGNSQEPFSYLASIKGIIKKRPLDKNINLSVIDLQSKPVLEKLRLNSFSDLFDYEKFPKYAGKSFIIDKRYPASEPNILSSANTYIYEFILSLKEKTQAVQKSVKPDYRVNDEIFNFVKNTYDNPVKSKWDSRVQDVVLKYPDNKFDIISANNVLPYIESDNEFLQTLKHITRILKKDGYFITDPYPYQGNLPKSLISDNFNQINPGIFKKK